MEAGRPENTLPGKGVADELKMLEQNPEEYERIVQELIQKSRTDAGEPDLKKRQTLSFFGIKKLFFQSCCARWRYIQLSHILLLAGVTDARLGQFIRSQGDCGYDSVALSMALSQLGHVPHNWRDIRDTVSKEYRVKVVEFLSANRHTRCKYVNPAGMRCDETFEALVQQTFDVDWEKYLSNQASSGTTASYADIPSLGALAHVLCRSIRVIRTLDSFDSPPEITIFEPPQSLGGFISFGF